MESRMTVVRRIAGLKFERTACSPYTKKYQAYGAFAVRLTYEIDTDRWSAYIESTHFFASLHAVRYEQLEAWLSTQYDRHLTLSAVHRVRREREVRASARAQRRADRGVKTVLAVVGAYFVGVVVGAASAATKVA